MITHTRCFNQSPGQAVQRTKGMNRIYYHYIDHRAILILALILLQSACGTTPPSSFYTLSPLEKSETVPNQSNCQNTAVALGSVSVPNYLQQEMIVTRTSPNKLELDEFHRWGGNLSEEFGRVLTQNLALLLNNYQVLSFPNNENIEVNYRISVDVQQFDGQLGKSANLEAVWSIYDAAKNQYLKLHRSSFDTPVLSNSYEQFVVAQSKLVTQLSKEIAAEMKNYCDI